MDGVAREFPCRGISVYHFCETAKMLSGSYTFDGGNGIKEEEQQQNTQINKQISIHSLTQINNNTNNN